MDSQPDAMRAHFDRIFSDRTGADAPHPHDVGIPASAAVDGGEPVEPGPPSDTVVSALAAATRMLHAIEGVERKRPWRDADLDRARRAATALASAYAEMLYERRLDQVGDLPCGLRLVMQMHDLNDYAVEDPDGRYLFDVSTRTSASLIRRLARCYVEGVHRGREMEMERNADRK